MDCVVAKQDSASDTLVLEFGFREPVGQAFSEEHRSQLKSQIAAFRGILNQLDESPSYRAGIRVLTIRLLCLEGATMDQEKVVNAFRDLVLCAIEYLPDLKVFRWATVDGVIPLTVEIVDALVGGKVEEFFMPVTRIADSDLSRLRELTTLALGLQANDRADNEYYDHTDAFADWQGVIVAANASTVQNLAVTASIRWQCDLPALRDAAFVGLLDCSLIVMDRLLRTSPHLTSLTITGAEPEDHKHTTLETVFVAFESAPSILPQLTSFKLLAFPHDSGVTVAHERIVATFLKNKMLLRRLHIDLSSGRRSFTCRSILEVLPTLPYLEVLGVQLSCYTLSIDELRLYDVHLPRNLTSLLVYARFGMVNVSPEELLSLFTTRTKLKTLMLVPIAYPTFRALDDALNPLLFDNRPASLEFLEWGRCVEGRCPDRSRTLVGFCPGPDKHNVFCSVPRGGRPFARKPFPHECGLEDWAWLREYDETNALSPDTGFELEGCNHRHPGETAMDVDTAGPNENLGAELDDDEEIDRITEHIDIRRIEGASFETCGS